MLPVSLFILTRYTLTLTNMHSQSYLWLNTFVPPGIYIFFKERELATAAVASDVQANLAVIVSLVSGTLECFRNISTFYCVRFTWMAGSLENKKRTRKKEMNVACYYLQPFVYENNFIAMKFSNLPL